VHGCHGRTGTSAWFFPFTTDYLPVRTRTGPDKQEPKRTGVKAQITNMGCPSDKFKRMRRKNENRDSQRINMALHKSQRTKTLNSGLIEGYNIVFLFSFVNNIGANCANWCQAK